jgi:hypothetical protein
LSHEAGIRYLRTDNRVRANAPRTDNGVRANAFMKENGRLQNRVWGRRYRRGLGFWVLVGFRMWEYFERRRSRRKKTAVMKVKEINHEKRFHVS